MILVRALLFVVLAGAVFLLLRLLPMRDTQRRFLLVATITALFLVLAFGKYAKEAVIALLVLGMAGLLAIDKVEHRRPDDRNSNGDAARER